MFFIDISSTNFILRLKYLILEEGYKEMLKRIVSGMILMLLFFGLLFVGTLFGLPVVTATVDIYPQTLNLKTRNMWTAVYIELPEGYDVADINVSSILLNDTVSPNLRSVAIGDYDNDNIPDLMVKFDRQAVIDYIIANVNMTELYEKRFMTITLTINGILYNGTPFQANTTIKIIMPMPRLVRYTQFL